MSQAKHAQACDAAKSPRTSTVSIAAASLSRSSWPVITILMILDNSLLDLLSRKSFMFIITANLFIIIASDKLFEALFETPMIDINKLNYNELSQGMIRFLT